MRVSIDGQGILLLQADNEERSILADAVKGYGSAPDIEISDMLRDTLELVSPESVGALTDAPIFAEAQRCHVEDDGTFVMDSDCRVWWFPAYETINPWEVLANQGRVIFAPAPENASIENTPID